MFVPSPGAWHPASPEESLTGWQRCWVPQAPVGPTPRARCSIAPVPRAGSMARGLMEESGQGGSASAPQHPARAEALCPERGSQMPGQKAVGTNLKSRYGFWGGHSQEHKPGLQQPKVPAGTGHPRGVRGWAGVGCGLPGAQALALQRVPVLLLDTSCCPSAPGMSPPLPRLWASPCPSSPGAHWAGAPPQAAHTTGVKQPPVPREPACCSNVLQATAAS